MGNHLAGAASPYLRLHAGNPVEWYAWGEEAFARARELQRPIFLSIGYYTCHWCHVMERESFADAATAELLNRDFVSIKVDREERPDVDRLYMTYVQATTGGGGWPMSVFLTPELKPFHGGTYYPPQDRHGLPGFPRLLTTIATAWREQRERLLASAEEVGRFLRQATTPAAAATGEDVAGLKDTVWPRLFAELSAGFDRGAGGFGGAPKFPRPVALSFLLRYAHEHRQDADGAAALEMVTATLRAMARGGIHDALGGGLHRYAVDANWRVPHFEKMLYDQAQLVIACVEAWQCTHADDLAALAGSTCDFVLREMTDSGGGFYSAQDADSEIPMQHRVAGGPSEGEGAYYLWTKAEIEELLPRDAAELFCRVYGVRAGGNVGAQLDPQQEFGGKNILYQAEEIAPADGVRLAQARQILYEARRQRPLPPTDTKILTAWNGLMISALAQAGAVGEKPEYVRAAAAAADFLWTERQDSGGGLLRTGGVAGFVEDYALLVQGLLDLYEADWDPRWREWARALQRQQEARFAAADGAYYSSGEDPHLFLRLREDYDGAEPSPNSVALSNLLRLDLLYEGEGWRERAETLVASFAVRLREMPQALPQMAGMLASVAAPARRLMITGGPQRGDTQALLRAARARFLPGYWMVPGPTEDKQPAAAYLCEDYTCRLPITAPAALSDALE
ncbi:MAG TPA: thioredoxin domain-containing protein [Terriglobales bacterium]|nr:thioredoxin domain-containing protein [Terriglobales bacterium]